MADRYPPQVRLVEHPLVQQKLTLLRDRHTGVEQFRRLVGELARLLVYELTRDFPMVEHRVETPLASCLGRALAVDITLVPILRAGLGLADAVLEMIPEARVGHLGIYRDAETLEPVVYYHKLPRDIAGTEVIILDPILATGGSVSKAISLVRQAGARRIQVMCLVAAPSGLEAVIRQDGEVPILTGGIDECLNDHGYVVPGLGDAGDRIYGTQ